MLRKTALIVLCLTVAAASAFATDFAECFALNRYFNENADTVHAKIREYEIKLNADKNDYYANLAVAILYTALASPMDNPEKGASGKILPFLGNFEKKEKDNPLALTVSGLGHSLRARDLGNPVSQLAEVNKAMAVFDRAVKISASDPIHWYVRYMRGNFYINLPPAFRKSGAAAEDFAFIHKRYLANPDIEGFMCNGYFYLGEIEKSKGNTAKAVEYWKLSVAVSSKLGLKSLEADKAARRLELYAD